MAAGDSGGEGPWQRRLFGLGRGCPGLLVWVLFAATAGAQQPVDPVESLRRALSLSPEFEPDRRRREVTAAVERLHSLADLSQALILREWRDRFLVRGQAPFDAQQRKKITEQFKAKVQPVLRGRDAAAQIAVAELLGEMGYRLSPSDPTSDVLRQFTADLIRLTRTGPTGVRVAAVGALGNIQAEPNMVVPALGELLNKDDEAGRLAAAKALGDLIRNAAQLGRPGVLGRESQSVARALAAAGAVAPVAAQALGDANRLVRRRAAEALALGAAQITPALEAGALVGPPAAGVQRQVRAVFAAFGPVLPRLADSLTDNDPDVRQLVGQALEDLLAARVAARPAQGSDLLREGIEKALPEFLSALSDDEALVRRRVAKILEQIGPEPATLPLLYRALFDSDRFVRWAAVRTLAELKHCPDTALLRGLAIRLTDRDSDIRLAVVRTLHALATLRPSGKSAPESCRPELSVLVSPLTCALKGPDARMQVGALRVLRALGPPSHPARSAITDLLRDPIPEVRQNAAQTLGSFGAAARPSLEKLQEALRDPSPEVREAVREALLRITLDQEKKTPPKR
jgi:HEAT repeat protein